MKHIHTYSRESLTAACCFQVLREIQAGTAPPSQTAAHVAIDLGDSVLPGTMFIPTSFFLPRMCLEDKFGCMTPNSNSLISRRGEQFDQGRQRGVPVGCGRRRPQILAL